MNVPLSSVGNSIVMAVSGISLIAMAMVNWLDDALVVAGLLGFAGAILLLGFVLRTRRTP